LLALSISECSGGKSGTWGLLNLIPGTWLDILMLGFRVQVLPPVTIVIISKC
jgi:hypothetical protein